MKIVSFDQGSDSWLKWRKGGIGASDISIIMGSNPYKTPLQLWEIKCGYREEDVVNRAMQHGINHEDVARQWLNQNLQLHLQPVCVEDDDKSHFRASLDGYDFDHETLVEIKCPISEKVLDRARMEQAIPDYWFDQMQWQIMLSNPKRAFIALWDYRTQNCITIDMFGHTKKIEAMRKHGDEFWRKVKAGVPPAPEVSDFVEVEAEGLQEDLLEYKELSFQKKCIDERQKELKKRIESHGDDGNFIAYGFKIVRMQPRTSYDMDKMRVDGIDVDLYVKKNESIGYYRIIPPKGS